MPIQYAIAYFARRLPGIALAQVRFRINGEDIVETQDFPGDATEAAVHAWAGKRVERFQKAQDVYLDCRQRIGTKLTVGDWRVEIVRVRYSLQPLRVLLDCRVWHPAMQVEAVGEYVIDSMDDYSVVRLRDWLIQWTEGLAERHAAAMAPEAQAVLDEMVA